MINLDPIAIHESHKMGEWGFVEGPADIVEARECEVCGGREIKSPIGHFCQYILTQECRKE